MKSTQNGNAAGDTLASSHRRDWIEVYFTNALHVIISFYALTK